MIPFIALAMEKIEAGNFIKKKRFTHWKAKDLKVVKAEYLSDKDIVGQALSDANKGEYLMFIGKGDIKL